MIGIILEQDEITYTEPNFDREWEEAIRYITHPEPEKKLEWGKQKWLDMVKNGKVVSFSEIKDNLGNITDVEDFDNLHWYKVERFLDSYSKKVIELPIAVKLPNGEYDLVAGNTRLTGLRKMGVDPKIWVFDYVKHEIDFGSKELERLYNQMNKVYGRLLMKKHPEVIYVEIVKEDFIRIFGNPEENSYGDISVYTCADFEKGDGFGKITSDLMEEVRLLLTSPLTKHVRRLFVKSLINPSEKCAGKVKYTFD